jgi:pimeloyl-ACP methyl ester carboxylesterase
MSRQAGGSYADVNGLKMYYEIHGAGSPLVVLHGAFMTIGAMGAFVPMLAETRQVVAAASSTSNGVYPEVWEGIEQITPEHFAGSPWKEEYDRVAPDPAAFPTLVEKMKQLDLQPFAWPPEEIRAISAPTMVVIGDSDGTTPEHAVELFRLRGGGVFGDLAGLPDARLAVLPGTTHVGLIGRAGWLVSMINEFLDAPEDASAREPGVDQSR